MTTRFYANPRLAAFSRIALSISLRWHAAHDCGRHAGAGHDELFLVGPEA